jgi:prolyl oligopeptidase
LQGTGTAGGKLFASWRKDVATRAYVFSLDGKLENEVVLPGVGTAGGFGGLSDDKYVFYSFTSFNYPPTIFKYDIATKKSTVFRTVDIPGFKAENYETKQSHRALRLRRLQRRHHSRLQLTAHGVARTGRGLRFRKPAWWW